MFLTILGLPRSTLFPYTTLFRSRLLEHHQHRTPRPGFHGQVGAHPPADEALRVAEAGISTDKDVALHVLAAEKDGRSEEHTSELQSRGHLVCRLLLEKKKNKKTH